MNSEVLPAKAMNLNVELLIAHALGLYGLVTPFLGPLLSPQPMILAMDLILQPLTHYKVRLTVRLFRLTSGLLFRPDPLANMF